VDLEKEDLRMACASRWPTQSLTPPAFGGISVTCPRHVRDSDMAFLNYPQRLCDFLSFHLGNRSPFPPPPLHIPILPYVRKHNLQAFSLSTPKCHSLEPSLPDSQTSTSALNGLSGAESHRRLSHFSVEIPRAFTCSASLLNSLIPRSF
jgi:hypothetical protein